MNFEELENYLQGYKTLKKKLVELENFYERLRDETSITLDTYTDCITLSDRGKEIIQLALQTSINRMKCDILFMNCEMGLWKKLNEEPVDEVYEKQKEELKESLVKTVRGQVE